MDLGLFLLDGLMFKKMTDI